MVYQAPKAYKKNAPELTLLNWSICYCQTSKKTLNFCLLL